MKILVSALLLLSFLSACEQLSMNRDMDGAMAVHADPMADGSMGGMDDNMSGT
jgi:hypothetical protein